MLLRLLYFLNYRVQTKPSLPRRWRNRAVPNSAQTREHCSKVCLKSYLGPTQIAGLSLML